MLALHSHAATSVTDIIRILKLGGDTFYRHKQVLARAELIRETAVRKTRTRTIYLELTDNGAKVAVHLERIAELLEPRFGIIEPN